MLSYTHFRYAEIVLYVKVSDNYSKYFFSFYLFIYVDIYRQILANKQWREKPILTTSSSWTPRWPLSGPYSGTSVKGSALKVEALDRFNGSRGKELFTV